MTSSREAKKYRVTANLPQGRPTGPRVSGSEVRGALSLGQASRAGAVRTSLESSPGGRRVGSPLRDPLRDRNVERLLVPRTAGDLPGTCRGHSLSRSLLNGDVRDGTRLCAWAQAH